MSRYFTNPAWMKEDRANYSVMEVVDDQTQEILRHKPLEGTCEPWPGVRRHGETGLERCLRAVELGSWIELRKEDVWPAPYMPQTVMEDAW